MKKAVFLDRDGTIIADKGYVYRVEDMEFLPGAIQGMKAFQRMGYLLIIITNQSGIARGYFTEEDYHIFMQVLYRRCEQEGVQINADYYCPHLPDALIEKYRKTCDCRKPNTGLFYKAAKEWGIDLRKSVAIGDKDRDIAICREVPGMQGFILREGKTVFDIAMDIG